MNEYKTGIHQRALLAARNFKRSEVDIIRSLQEVKDSLLFLDFELDSLNKYAVQIMELSESAAYNFINVANKASQVPVLQEAILDGSVLVSKARKVTSVLTLENKAQWPEWVEKIKVLTQKQLEREVAKVNPKEATPETTKYVSENRLELRMGVSQELLDDFRQAQNIVSRSELKTVDLEETLQTVLIFYLEAKDPKRRAERILKKNSSKQSVLRTVQRSKSSGISKAIPAQVKHQVILRDQAQCTYVIAGKRCENTRWIQTHHIVHRSVGGDHSVENLTTLCSAHHKMLHRT